MAIENQQIKESFLASVNGDLPTVQAVLKQNIQQLLAVEMSTLESDLRQQLASETRDLLQSVKFVLPKS
jgi:K+-sensing histidine kinase KdpD